MEPNTQTQVRDTESERIATAMSRIKHRIAVFSGKGGVGKSTVSVNLAFGLTANNVKVGLLDADITGPNVPKMLNLEEDNIYINETLIPFEKQGVKVISMAGLIPKGQPLIWRGPMRSKVVMQFLADVDWGELDYLIADLPPGTGDEILTISQEMKPDFAVIVTTPQDVSVMDAERAVNMARKLGIPFIGIVENMSGLTCPYCNCAIDILGHDGGKDLAAEMGVDFLGKIPFEIAARKMSDFGLPMVLELPDSAFSLSVMGMVGKIESLLNQKT